MSSIIVYASLFQRSLGDLVKNCALALHSVTFFCVKDKTVPFVFQVYISLANEKELLLKKNKYFDLHFYIITYQDTCDKRNQIQI